MFDSIYRNPTILIFQCSIDINVRLIRVKNMSQYCKWDDLKKKMLDIQEEVYFHENRLDEFKIQFRAKLMNRESLLAHWTGKLAIATAEFKEQDSVVRWHEKMLGL